MRVSDLISNKKALASSAVLSYYICIETNSAEGAEMKIMEVIVSRKNGEQLNLGVCGTATKMNMFRAFQKNQASVCNLFGDCGEFTFEWSEYWKMWEFFDERGSKVGSAKFERNSELEKEKAERYYAEQKAAYDAQERNS